MPNFIEAVSGRGEMLPVYIMSKGETECIYCRREGKLGVIKEGDSCLEDCIEVIDGEIEILRD